MKPIKSIFLSTLLLAVIFIAGCEQGPTSSIEPVGTLPQLSKFSLPAGVTLESAELHIYKIGNYTLDVPVNVHNVTSDWDEMVVTWNNFGGAFDGNIEGSFQSGVGSDHIWRTVDITGLVNGWLQGTIPNYGLLLDQIDLNYPRIAYSSKETLAPDNLPAFIKLFLSNGEQVDVPVIADTYIYENAPGINSGSEPILYTGWLESGDLEKQTLLKFDIEPTQDYGCTLTQGYWKTHSTYGPAPYNETWALIGEDAPFFLSNRSYYNVLWKHPIGNPYYILAHQYIAAKLNILKGADPSAIQSEFDAATDLFSNYSPMQIALMRHNNQIKRQFLQLAIILGKYNLGLIGPGHC
jgi:hypothetical protein